MLFNIMDRKEYSLDQKSEVSKSSEKSSFSKGLVHGFCQKIELFTMCAFSKPRRKRLLFNIMDRKEYSLDQKSEVSKSSEKSSFSKG